MRLLFVVDGRSPIALNWIQYFCQDETHEVHLVSTYPCTPQLRLTSAHVIPTAFATAAGTGETGTGASALARRVLPVGFRTGLRQWLAPMTLPGARRSLQDLIRQIQPDLVHAMRIPYEGMLAGLVMEKMRSSNKKGERIPPLVLSVWGNDFTLHARATPQMAALTRLAVRHATALHADCQRDLRLAAKWGFDPQKPRVLLPGSGGVQLDIFFPSEPNEKVTESQHDSPRVINPRGFRAYVRNDAFFHAIPRVLKEMPDVRFVCPAMAGEAKAERWVKTLGIQHAVELLPQQPRPKMAELFRSCQVAVSPTTHDGTPNTLLEGMACGCFPVAGDIESLQEWVKTGINGLLVDPRSPDALADAILHALRDPQLRRSATEINTRLVAERADYWRVMADAEKFYRKMLEVKSDP